MANFSITNSTAVGAGRLPLCLSEEQPRRRTPGSLAELVRSGTAAGGDRIALAK